MESKPLLHGGYLMRSQLEARWATFFEKLGLGYLYECELFDTPHGQYLPDLFIPSANLWIEIKPGPPSEKELGKLVAVAKNKYTHCILLAGFPSRNLHVTSEAREITRWFDADAWIIRPTGNTFHLSVQQVIDAIEDISLKAKVKVALRIASGSKLASGFAPVKQLLLLSSLKLGFPNSYEYNIAVSKEKALSF